MKWARSERLPADEPVDLAAGVLDTVVMASQLSVLASVSRASSNRCVTSAANTLPIPGFPPRSR